VPPRIVEVRSNILKKNDLLARDLRARFQDAGVYVVNLVSAPGTGKTSLLQRTLAELNRRHRVAAITGDLATDNDARRLAESGAAVRQVTTGTVCHLDAEMLERSLEGWALPDLDFLFIENVGNLVCPSSYDLGESLRVVLLSVTEGEDKPLKYPTIYHTADLAVITKIDLADAVEFDRVSALRNIQEVRPGLPVLEVSARTGQGMAEWLRRLEESAAPLTPPRSPRAAGSAPPGGPEPDTRPARRSAAAP
jgi:hydrogenase nickel incorporation protein HypB